MHEFSGAIATFSTPVKFVMLRMVTFLVNGKFAERVTQRAANFLEKSGFGVLRHAAETRDCKKA